MELSIVTTLYQSAPYIEEFYARINKVASSISPNHEIIFVNDGSRDESLQKILAIKARYPEDNIKVLDLSRNFGHHKAIMTGFGHAVGKHIFFIDVDLEEEPELLERFWGQLKSEQDVDVVYGVQTSRKGGRFEQLSGSLFYSLFNAMSDHKLPKNFIMARLMTKRYLQAFLLHKEKELVFGGICELTGFKQIGVEVEKGHKGITTYSFRKKMFLALNLITSFSNRPLIYISYLGLLATFFAILFIIVLVVYKFTSDTMLGWVSLIASIWLVGGIIIFCMGIIGVYISKIFTEVKDRPLTITKEIYE